MVAIGSTRPLPNIVPTSGSRQMLPAQVTQSAAVTAPLRGNPVVERQDVAPPRVNEKGLPEEHRILSAEEETCNPELQRCKTPTYVYEVKCLACAGTGTVRYRRSNRRGTLGSCMCCHGLGYVREASTSFKPGGGQQVHTINRPRGGEAGK